MVAPIDKAGAVHDNTQTGSVAETGQSRKQFQPGRSLIYLFPCLPIVLHPDIIIFDVDGTLVDVTLSYRETTPAAARIYLELLGLQPPVLTGDVYDTFKRMTGFNDDWDLTAGLLRVLLAGLPLALPLPDRVWPSLDALIAALRAASQPLVGLTPPLPDWEPLVSAVRAAGGGLAGLSHVIPDRNAHLVWRTGDAATTDLVQRIFSETYLGAELFAAAYGCAPRFHNGPGLREHETMLIDPDHARNPERACQARDRHRPRPLRDGAAPGRSELRAFLLRGRHHERHAGWANAGR